MISISRMNVRSCMSGNDQHIEYELVCGHEIVLFVCFLILFFAFVLKHSITCFPISFKAISLCFIHLVVFRFIG